MSPRREADFGFGIGALYVVKSVLGQSIGVAERCIGARWRRIACYMRYVVFSLALRKGQKDLGGKGGGLGE